MLISAVRSSKNEVSSVMSILSRLRNEFIVSFIVAACTSLAAYLWEKTPILRSFLLEKISVSVKAYVNYEYLLATIILTYVIIVPLIIRAWWIRSRLIFKYGVFWDDCGNSYCPACKKPTSQLDWVAYDNKQWRGLKCSCQDKPFLFMDNGYPVKGENAVAIMKK